MKRHTSQSMRTKEYTEVWASCSHGLILRQGGQAPLAHTPIAEPSRRAGRAPRMPDTPLAEPSRRAGRAPRMPESDPPAPICCAAKLHAAGAA